MIISNNLIDKIPLPAETIIRINLAWIKDKEEARRIIAQCKHDIYLDYPSGRTKPPKPTITLEEAQELITDKVKYFAISNAESIPFIRELMKLPTEIVPKIETPKGVLLIPKMKQAGIKTIMLDKEDLYTSVNCDNYLYNQLLAKARANDIKILELQGVVFI